MLTTTQEKVEYGIGSLSSLSGVLEDLGAKRVFIVTGKSLATKTNVVKKVEHAAEEGGKTKVVYVFSDIGQHAPMKDIRKAVDVIKDQKVDVVIAVGGGSPIDSGKMIKKESKKTNGKGIHLICIPTTLSAAEMSIIAAYTSRRSFDISHTPSCSTLA